MQFPIHIFSEPTRARQGVLLSLLALAFFMPWSRSGVSVFTALAVFFWAIDFISGEKDDNKSKKNILFTDNLVIALGLYLAYLFISLLWTDDFFQAWKNLKHYGHFFLVPVFLTSFNKEKSKYIIYAFIAGFLIHITASYLSYFHVPGFITKYPNNPHVFMHHLDYSMLLAFFSILLFNRFYRGEYNIKQKAVYLVLAIAGTVLLFIVKGRSGQLAFFATIPFLIILAFPKGKRVRGLFSGILLIGFIFGAAFFLSGNFKNRVSKAVDSVSRVMTTTDYQSSIGKRIFVGKMTWNIFLESPLFGKGIGDNMDALRGQIEKHAPEELKPGLTKILRTHFHNQYYQILAETGLIGLLLFLHIFYQFVRKFNSKTEFGVLALLLTVMFLVGFIGEPFAQNQFTSVLLAYFMGLCYFTNKNQADDEPTISQT
ncbi:MAG: O-antigen ligase family protein [Leptospirales bacterium]